MNSPSLTNAIKKKIKNEIANMKMREFKTQKANRIELDEMACYKLLHLDLHCLQCHFFFQLIVLNEYTTSSMTRNSCKFSLLEIYNCFMSLLQA